MNPPNKKIYKAVRKKLNGLQIRYKKIKPVVAVRNTDNVLDNE